MNISVLRRNLFEPLYLKKSNSPKISYWRELEKTQYYSTDELKNIQWQRLQKLWNFVWRNNSYYKKRFLEYGLNENSLKFPDDIRLLPVLTKKEIRDNSDTMISNGFDKNKLLHFKTGGSTGKALDIYITEEGSEMRNACARRHDRWTGWEPGEPIAAAWGNPKLPKTVKEKMVNYFIQPYIYLDTMAVTEASVKAFASAWKKVKPALLFGHAHSIFILAQYIEKMDIELRLKGIISTSMMLLPHERKVIEKVFQCKVTDRYGCEEVSLIGCECEMHEGMHMNIEHLVIEFVKDDGSYAVPGEPGNIVVTDLMNYAMPFIRYKVEDMGVHLNKICSCGRGLPLMGNVAGRLADFLIKKDGTKVAGVSLIENTLTKFKGIDQMQIIQENLSAINLNIVRGLEYSDTTDRELVDYFKQVFGKDVFINIVFKTKIEPELNGKYRFSICQI